MTTEHRREPGRLVWAKATLAPALVAIMGLILAAHASAQGEMPQLAKSFSPDQVQVGETTTLEFTITNPVASAQNWSFTDQLAEGLEVAQSTPVSNTCDSTTVTAPLGGSEIQVNGQVPASGSCAVAMELAVNLEGRHVNAASNITQATNIAPPTSPTEVECGPADDPPTGDIVGVFVNCEFSDEPPATDFTISQDWQSSTETIAYQTPVVGDLFGTGNPAIVVGGNRAATGGNPIGNRLANDLKVYDGATGDLLHTITTPRYSWSSFSAAAIADVDGDGRGEIIFRAASYNQTQADATAAGVPTAADINGRLVAYKYDPGDDDWNVMWVSNERYDQGPHTTANNARSGAALSLADFNGDGTAEVYVGNEIFSARTGSRLAAGTASQASGCQQGSPAGCFLAQTVAVDTDGDGDLELAAGDTVYDVEITNPNGEAGNTMTVAAAADPSNANALDGLTAVADLDLDGAPEIVVTTNANNTRLYVWDPRTEDVEAMRLGSQMVGANGSSGSAPMIGDIDDDGRPEIVIVTTNRLRAFDFVPGASTLAGGLSEIWTLTVSDGSGGTSTSMFDFNSDGENEIVYRDEGSIRIIDGGPTPPNTTNRNLASFSCGSGTSVDMPVIADIDGSGEARIVVTCGVTNNSTGAAVRSYETGSFSWANTRPVWNQQTYFVTHINDDLTVPTEQFPNWAVFNDPDQLCSDGANRPLNNFQVQVTDIDSETGCPVICAPPSLEIDKTSDPPTGSTVKPGDTITYTVTIENTVNDDIPDVDLTDDLSQVLDDASITDGPTVTPGGAGTAQINGDELTFNGTIPGNGTVTITYETTVNEPDALGDAELGNAVLGEFSNCDGITGQLRCTTEHPVAALLLEKAADPGTVNLGDEIEYTFTLTNTGLVPLTGLAVDDPLPGMSPPVCEQTDLDAGDSTTCTATKTTNAADVAAGEIVNTATAAGEDPDGEAVTSNEATATVVAEAQADLHLEKSTNPALVSPGAQFTYFVSVTNQGPNASTGSTITDTLPDGVTVVAYNEDDCDLEGQTFTCEVGPLMPNGEALGYNFLVEAPDTPSTCFDNTASVEGVESDPDPDDNGDSARTCTTPAADLAVFKSVTNNLVSPGGQVEYTLTIQNNGPDDATGVTVTDTLPDGLTNIEAPGGCDVQGTTVTCEIGTMAAPTESNILITANAPDVPSTCFDNVAAIEGNQGDPDVTDNESDPARVCTTPAADLELSKTAPAEVDPHGEVTWTLTVTNNGPDASTGSTVTDELPGNVSNVQVPQNCGLQGQTVTCTVGAIPASGSTEIEITGEAPGVGSVCFENDASVEGAEGDPDPENNNASFVTCTRESDLELAKTIDTTLMSPGDPVIYTLTVTNHGPDESQPATVTDTLPGSLSSVVIPQNCTLDGNDVTCDIGPLAVDGTAEIEITANAPNTPSTCFENDASVAGAGDLNSENDTASVRACTTPAADLELEKSADATVDPGGVVTWSFAVTNHGPDQSTGSTVTDTLPGGITDIAVPANCTVQDQTVTCEVGTLDPSGTAQFSFTGRAPNTAETCFENDASIEGEEGDPDLANNDASAETCTNEGADLETTKTADDGSHVAGGNVTYTVTVTNHGPAAADDVQVTDNLPGSLNLVSADPEQGTCSAVDPIECDLGTIGSGDSVSIEVVASIAADQAGNEIENTACVAGEEPDPEADNDCATEPITVDSEVGLAISKSANQGPFFTGDNVTYTLIIANTGPNVATEVEVDDDLPDSLTLVSATPDQGTCDQTDPIHCELGEMAVDDVVEIEIVATIAADQAGQEIENTACVEAVETDPDTQNNCGTDTIQVEPEADLEVTKEPTAGPYKAGSNVTYTITVTNNGPNDATDVSATDDLPGSLTLVSATPSQGACAAGDPVECSLGALANRASATIEIVARIGTGQGGAGIENTACAGAVELDPDDSNNCGDAQIRVAAPPKGNPRLKVAKRASDDSAHPGEVLVYKITVRNKGKAAARKIRVCDRLPSGQKALRAPGANQRTKKRVCWKILRLAAGAKKSFRVTTQINTSAKPGKQRNKVVANGRGVKAARGGETVSVSPAGDTCPRFARC